MTISAAVKYELASSVVPEELPVKFMVFDTNMQYVVDQ